MNKFYSRLGWFCIGILVGATGIFLYQMGQAEPKVEKCRLDFLYGMPDEDLFDVIDGIRGQIQ